MMGGTIWVESELGVGSTFHITFSAELQPNQANKPSIHQQHPALVGKRMLIVYNNATGSDIVSRYATAWGMETHIASSMEETLVIIHQGQPVDVIVLSILNPCMMGIQLAQTLFSDVRTQHIPNILYFCPMCRKEIESQLTKNIVALLPCPIRPLMLYDALRDVFEEGNHPRASILRHDQFDESMSIRHPLRILLAEDNVVNQKVALHMLAKMGYRADIAANGIEVLDALQRRHYDVVLMDVQMPEMDGIEATKHIRTTIPIEQQPQIVAMTAHALQGNREWLIAAGMDDYVSKPIQVNQFVATLQRCQPAIMRTSNSLSQELGTKATHTHGGDTPDSAPSMEGLEEEKHRETPTNEPTLDTDILHDFCSIMGEDVAKELIHLYLADTPLQLESMQQSYAQSNNDEFTRAAHTLKSSSAQVGAMRLSHLCAALEHYDNQGDTGPTVEALLNEAEKEFVRLREQLSTVSGT